MGGDSLFIAIETLWVAVTLIYGALLSYRLFLNSKEDDQLLLEASDSGLEQEQKRIASRLSRLNPYSRGFGFASLLLFLVVCGVWIYRGYHQFLNPAQP